MNPVAAAVILYNPDRSALMRNISSYIFFVAELFIIDNSASVNKEIIEELREAWKNITYIPNKRNLGIAAALNIAAAEAEKKGYEWMMTMDQDSYFEQADIETYFTEFKNRFYNRKDVGIVAPVYGKEVKVYDDPPFSEVLAVITSGSIMQLSVWRTCGRFDEKLFIDEVDHEYCYRITSKGYKVVSFNHVFLKHHLGTKVERGYLSFIKKKKRTIHNPTRVYFIVRNYYYVRNIYATKYPEEFKTRDKRMKVFIKNNLLFSGRFLATLKSILNGYRDFKRGKFDAVI